MTYGERLMTIGTAITLSFAIGFLAGEYSDIHSGKPYTSAAIISDTDFAPVWEAWNLLEEKFVPASTTQKVSKKENIWGIIDGLARSYNDPYTVFLSPDEAKNFEEEISGTFGGIGVDIGIRDDILTVISPLKGTPADIAGLHPGDRIVKVDAVSTQQMTIDEAVKAIRGEVGTTVMLTIAREGEKEFLEIPIKRAVIDVPTIKTELKDPDVFVISLYNFGGTATREFRTALRTFIESGRTKLVIDLRGNPGGYLEAAVDIASWLLPGGKTVVTEDYGPLKKPLAHRTKSGQSLLQDDWEIVVLVDGGSASASEILAGALREHEVAVLIGEQTFGKGSVQELVQMSEDSALKITIARWLTPNGNSLSDGGLTPDLNIELTPQDIEAARDPQLDAAIHYLNTGILEYTPIIENASSSPHAGVDDTQKIE